MMPCLGNVEPIAEHKTDIAMATIFPCKLLHAAAVQCACRRPSCAQVRTSLLLNINVQLVHDNFQLMLFATKFS